MIEKIRIRRQGVRDEQTPSTIQNILCLHCFDETSRMTKIFIKEPTREVTSCFDYLSLIPVST